jgi:hypothetical protein
MRWARERLGLWIRFKLAIVDFGLDRKRLKYQSVYYRPTNLLLLPLLIGAVSLVYKQNYFQLNPNSPAPESALPQLKVFTFKLPFHPNSVS